MNESQTSQRPVRRPGLRTLVRHLPWHGRVCFWVIYISFPAFLIVPVVSALIRSPSIPFRDCTVHFWLGSACAISTIVAMAVFVPYERIGMRITPGHVLPPPLYVSILAWFACTAIIAGIWLLVYVLFPIGQTPNHALQPTAPCVTAPASAAFPPTMQPARQPPPWLSLGSLG